MRVDFHLHTPASRPHFRLPGGVDPDSAEHRERLARLYVERLNQAGITVGALTDYNLPRDEWYELIGGLARERGITLFPGVELSLSGPSTGKEGLHVLVLFPLDVDLSAVRRAIESLHCDPHQPIVREDGTHGDVVLAQDLVRALGFLRESFRCLLIMAHVGEGKGLMKSYSPRQAAQIIRELRPDALEGLTAADRERLASTGVMARQEVELLVSIESSDPHDLEEIGAKQDGGRVRSTSLKLSAFDDLEAIRLALEDPAVRVRVGEPPPPTRAAARLLSLRVEGTGFLGGVEIEFSDDLNALVGGRGVGKSAVLETLRYAMDLAPFAPAAERDGLVRHALGSGGKVIVRVQVGDGDGSPGHRYRIERILNERPLVFDEELGSEVGLAPEEVMDEQHLPLFFGQREIYELTREEARGGRLRLLDELSGSEVREKLRFLRKLEEELRREAREIEDTQGKLAERDEIEAELKAVRYKIALFRERGVLDKLREAADLARDKEYLDQVRDHLGELASAWPPLRERVAEFRDRAAVLAARGQSRLAYLLARAAEIASKLARDLEAILGEGAHLLQEAGSRVDEVAAEWETARRPLVEELSLLKRELGLDSLAQEELEALAAREARLQQRLARLEELKARLDEKIARWRRRLSELGRLRHEVFRLRQTRVEKLNAALGGRVRIAVHYKGGLPEFQEKLRGLLSGAGVDRSTIERLCCEEGVDGAGIAAAIREGPEALATRFDLSAARAKRICQWFDERRSALHDLELLAPDDRVYIMFSVDGSERSLERLSAGQRATAFLLILLSLGGRPLIVDQPEDDLDNRFIFEDVVRLLREQKGRRQIVVATHNPNIPVLGDAELILVLDAERQPDGREAGRVALAGSIDGREVREAVKRIMEGGEEAFLRRARKYGWPTGGASR